MDDYHRVFYELARDDFYQARRRASAQMIFSRLRGQREQLLSYEEIRHQLKADIVSSRKELRDIPLDAIVGSVNRYEDFTRDFFPKETVSADRWMSVKVAGNDPGGLPPIEVFQIGEVYFVNDGNHRVSIARAGGQNSIQAYVTEVKPRVPLQPSDSPKEIIIKAELANFLETTRLDLHRPDADLAVTVPEAYSRLLEHISVHQYYMGLDLHREVSCEEAAVHWYDTYYLPIIEMIQNLGLPRDFPGNTPADLYLWLCDHRARLEEKLGDEISPSEAALDLAASHSPRITHSTARLIDAVLPDSLEGASPGLFRQYKEQTREEDRLFSDILVPVNGTEQGWFALEQAFIISRYEQARLRGLHVVPDEKDRERPESLAVQAEFNRRCSARDINGRLVLATGEVSHQITERAALNDLVVLNLSYPPGSGPIGRLTSGFRKVVQRSPRPLLAVPETVSELRQAILAYDGSSTSKEALYIGAYIAGRWGTRLTVLTILEGGRVTQETVDQARSYLEERGVSADFVQKDSPPAQAILEASENCCPDLVIMGGYGRLALVSFLLDTVADQVLRESRKPMLLCR